ncbi:MAG TPA: radical SAM protein [Cyanobacteria bacterium UBA8530]|nr:radical SAM protein [Cyanobacteria bacterium UBA8530]
MNDLLRIHEIFSSIQGEGLFLGAPSTFIRLTGCNLRCSWCDTKFAFEEGSEMSLEDIRVENRHVVITGGEPLLQNIEPLVSRLKKNFVTVETNATIFSDLGVNLWSLSPKLGSSGHRGDPAIADAFLFRHPGRLQMKFVVAEKEDLDAIKEFLSSLRNLKEVPILLQPEGSGSISEKLGKLRDLAETVCGDPFFAKIDVRVLPQLHQLLWPDERGK